MFIPSKRTWTDMMNESAGFWPVPIDDGKATAFLLKASTNVIKAAYKGVSIELSIVISHTKSGDVLSTALTIYDDSKSPMIITGVSRHAEEHKALSDIVRKQETLFVFFDELSRPVVRARCVLDPKIAPQAILEMEKSSSWYSGSWSSELSQVLDEVDTLVDTTQEPAKVSYAPTLIKIPLKLDRLETSKIIAVGSSQNLVFQLEDSNEGYGFEQSTWQLLENLFQENIFHSPQILEPKASRELIDVFAFCVLGQCLFETKALAVLATELDRSSARRDKGVSKQIEKGITQLQGAIRALERKTPLATPSGVKIEVTKESENLRVGVVMISELLTSLDWPAMTKKVIDAAKKIEAPIIVLDLQELRFLVGISKSPNHLLFHLVRRFEVMVKNGSAMIRSKIDGPPPP